MTLRLSPRATDVLASDAKLKQVKVLVCTETCNFNGYTYCMNHQRLLDALNRGLTANSMPIGKDFIPLTNVEVFFQNQEREFIASLCIRKASILFVGEKSEREHEISKNKDRAKIYPMRVKTPVRAEIHIPLHTLTGQLYAETEQQTLLEIVERADKFLPLTNVEIYPPLDNVASMFDFVAVNREKIIYVCESLKLTKALFVDKEPIVMASKSS